MVISSALFAEPPRSGERNVAPNTALPVLKQVLPAIVKLYGSGVGREHGYGTGVIISEDGKVLTVSSLLVASRNLRVTLSDGRTFPAKLVRDDEYRQTALIQIQPEGDAQPGKLPYLTPAKSNHLRIGDSVIAVGNWYKVADGPELVSVSRGILGAKANLSAQRLTQDFEYEGQVLLYDAITSNPGAPGGALLDIDGNFVGLVGRIVESTGTLTRINWALPGEEISAFLGGEPSPAVERRKQAEASAATSKPDLGIKLARLGFQRQSAYVERVRPDSPAAKAGVKADDLVLSLDGRRVTDAESFEEALNRTAPGQTVALILKRGNQVIQTTATVGVKP